MILLVLSCRPAKTDRNDLLLSYSKGPCLGRCPVYDFKVFANGHYVYRKGGRSAYERQGRLSETKMKELTTALKQGIEVPDTFRRIRDLPVTKLRFGGNTYEYHASRTAGRLKRLDRIIAATAERYGP